MPSVQQLHHEELAAIVEKAAKPSILGPSHRACKFRVKTRDGKEFDLYLSGVDLDGQLLVGLGWGKEPPPVSLLDIQTVWHAKPRSTRVAALFAGGTLAGAGVALLVGTVASPLADTAGVLIGATVGALAASFLVYFLQNWRPMHSWELVYESPAA